MGAEGQVDHEPLSEREREILKLIAEGMSNQQIADQLNLTLGTVKWYNKQAFQKLRVHSRTQAILRANEFGYLVEAVPTPKHNLPALLTSFIGREKEISAVRQLLGSYRLVTLTGSGGTGKTRLALQVAGLVLVNYPDGAWLVELATLSEPASIPATIAQALGVPDTPSKSFIDSLVDALRSKRLLLILDSCEHMLEDCANLAGRLLHACPDLTILVSSREFLGVEGEAPYRVPPMSFPDLQHLPTLEVLLEYDALRLFDERGRLASPAFSITENNARTVVQVVSRLDGIPLAIELAASRLRLLGIEQIAQRLKDAFRLLTNGNRTALPRHQTLRASIDWSYELLSESERILFRRLAVFPGDWQLQATEQVCTDEPQVSQSIQPGAILDLLTGLVDKSLVITEPETNGSLRYRMLETIRQYAHEKLEDEGEAAATRTRHLAYYLRLAEELAPKIRGPELVQTLDRLEVELANLRLALKWALQTDVEAGLRLAAALQWFWHLRALWSEGIDWLEQCLELEQQSCLGTPRNQVNNSLHAKSLTALGFHRLMQTVIYPIHVTKQDQVKKALEESLEIFQAIRSDQHPEIKGGKAWANLWLAVYKREAGDWVQALTMAQVSLTSFREIDDLHGIDESLQLIGMLESDPVRRKHIHQEQLDVARTIGDIERIAVALGHLGIACFENGDYHDAFTAFQSSLAGSLPVKNPITDAWNYFTLGILAQSSGNLFLADGYFRRALDIYQTLGNENRIASCLLGRCYPALAEGRYGEVAEMSDEAWCIYQRTGDPTIALDVLDMRTRLARIGGDLTTAKKHAEELLHFSSIGNHHKMQALLELGHLAILSEDLEQARSLFQNVLQILTKNQEYYRTPQVLDAMAILAARKNQMERAAQLFGTRWRRGYFHFLSPPERTRREADLAASRAILGEGRFKQLYERGRVMTREEALALAQEEADH